VLLGSIQAALQTLPPEQRDVFVAHEIMAFRSPTCPRNATRSTS